MILARRRLAPVAGDAGRARLLGAIVAYVAFGVHGVNVVSALNRDAAFVSSDSFPTEIAHLFGKPGVFPVDHDLLKAALVAIVLYLLWRTWRGYDWVAASGWTLLAISVTSTWLLAWYILWPLPLAVIVRDRRLLAATLAVQALFVAAPDLAAAGAGEMSAGASQPVASGGRDDCLDGLPQAAAPARAGLRRIAPAGAGGSRRTLLVAWACSCWSRRSTTSPARQGVNHRLNADLRTWRAYTGHDYQNLAVDTPAARPDARKREVVCGNTSPGRAEGDAPDLPADLGPDRRRPARGARRLVSAAALGGRRAPSATAASGRQRRELLPPVSAAAPPLARAGARRDAAAELARWWPLAALTLLGGGAAPVHARPAELLVRRGLHARPRSCTRASAATLHAVVHTENNPPLWYLIAWADSRVLGTGAVALRLPSALAGIALVPGRLGDRQRARRAARGDPAGAPWWPSTRCSCGTRRRRAPTGCSCSPPGWRSSASCAPTACPRARGWRGSC